MPASSISRCFGSIELYDRTLTRDKLDRVLRETRARNGWLIFYTHDVAEPPSWIGSSPRLLHETIEAVQAENMRCLTVRDALAAIGYRRTAEASAKLSARAARRAAMKMRSILGDSTR